ncbi:hypothetical protein Tco_0099673 [Tanacetum coccineum]
MVGSLAVLSYLAALAKTVFTTQVSEVQRALGKVKWSDEDESPMRIEFTTTLCFRVHTHKASLLQRLFLDSKATYLQQRLSMPQLQVQDLSQQGSTSYVNLMNMQQTSIPTASTQNFMSIPAASTPNFNREEHDVQATQSKGQAKLRFKTAASKDVMSIRTFQLT